MAAASLGWMGLFPWVLARSRREVTGGRWPRRIVRTHGVEHAGDGAYRETDVPVERVVAVELGPPAEVGREGRRAFSSAALMFAGGVLSGAWVPVQLWLTRSFVPDFTMAYASGALVAGGWILAAFMQFRAGWARWEPCYDEARSTAQSAARAATYAAAASLFGVLLAHKTYGSGVTLIPVWLSLVAGLRAWRGLRAIGRHEALYRHAERMERVREGEIEGVAKEGTDEGATGVRVRVDGDEAEGGQGAPRDEERASRGTGAAGGINDPPAGAARRQR